MSTQLTRCEPSEVTAATAVPSTYLPPSRQDGTALVLIHDASCCLAEPSWSDRVPPVLVGAGVLSCMVTLIALGACLPLKLLWVLGAVFVALVVLAAVPSRRDGTLAIAPSEIADLELRGVYHGLLAAHAELAGAVVSHRGSPLAHALLDQSRDLVIACGQRACTTNPVTRYLSAHAVDAVAGHAAQARDHAVASGDAAARERWTVVDATRQRQLATIEELVAQRDSVRADLEAAVARIEITTAEVVKQHLVDAEAIAADACAEHGAALQDMLDGLRSAQATLPPA